MTACEKCWRDAGGIPAVYAELMEDRKLKPCTPEQQAGPDASFCWRCGRRTAHQLTHECMVPGCIPRPPWHGHEEVVA